MKIKQNSRDKPCEINILQESRKFGKIVSVSVVYPILPHSFPPKERNSWNPATFPLCFYKYNVTTHAYVPRSNVIGHFMTKHIDY